MNKPAALYARVSSDRQKENHTIASQVAALIQFAETNGYLVPPEWQFQDDGYSGATLVRPGLEALRDLAAAGEIQTVLIYSPDRLSRKYAYQVLLAEELARCGVELIFLRAPSGATAEDQLLVQFQGMIAEYERAQIAERSRRGKRHRAQQGSINVLSGAPYGYRYIKKTDTSAAYYEVVESEAEVVRFIFDAYTRQGLSIAAIAGLLNQREVPTRTRESRWERPTLWRMLHNPAYAGHAFYGKTELRPRQRITRRLRQRGLCSRDSSFRERPRPEWIEIPVPALVSEATFALAQEQFEKNKKFSPRRTLEPSLLQGLLVCQRCGYGLYRTSTRTSRRTIYYYRCLGRDGYRHLKGAVCDNRPIRQEQLDAVVWQEIMRLLEDPSLLQAELDRRLHAAQTTDPLKRREEALRRDQARLTKSMERLLTGYQENLITLEELRCRMPDLRKQQRANEAELQSLEMTAVDPTRNLRLLETLAQFRTRLHARGNVLEVAERQRVLRLLVHEILVSSNNITIRHSIPLPTSSPDPNHGVRPSHEPPEPNTGPNYLLRSHGQHAWYDVSKTRVWIEVNFFRWPAVLESTHVHRRQSEQYPPTSRRATTMRKRHSCSNWLLSKSNRSLTNSVILPQRKQAMWI
ncbi:MAG TPA: recombinase family protein [Candidatus Sulfotelmatobacter sp.]|nr:recombinase family protein [Candidatus Sulfotelmatobacter sp.]